MMMPFVFSKAVIESEIYWNECLAWMSVLQTNLLYVVHTVCSSSTKQIELYLSLPQVPDMAWKWVKPVHYVKAYYLALLCSLI